MEQRATCQSLGTSRTEDSISLAAQVLTHLADRLKDLHAAGFVHRDIKPGNVLWLPRKKRWTLIDFGCVARTNEEATTGFTLSYAAPEVIDAHKAGQRGLVATEALDAWSVGILAIEVFTGEPVFDIFQSKEDVRHFFLPTVHSVCFSAGTEGHLAGSWESCASSAACTQYHFAL